MMTESYINYKNANDDEILKMKSTESSTFQSNSPPSSLKTKQTRLTFPFGACRVCSDSATGIHYGIATCEGCKGFFKRSILRKEKYRCYFDSSCRVNVTNRNRCKACRFRRCIDEGMSVDGVKMGRIPKLVKEKALREQKEQQMKQKAPSTETNERSDEVHARESPCPSLSDRSIENDDPNAMETDMMDLEASAIRRHCEPTKICPNNNLSANNSLLHNDRIRNRSTNQANLSEHDINSTLDRNQSKNQSIIYQTKYPTFLPDDFTLDETSHLTEHSTGPLSDEIFQHVHTISNKLSLNKTNLVVQLTEDELKFTRFLRWSAYNIFLRHSKRVKQLELRMNQMIHGGINEYPGEDATTAQFFATVPKCVEVLVRSCVFYIQELPGMTNMDSRNLHKMILHRSFDWLILKYINLFNGNGQCYFVSADGLQYTRHWIDIFYGIEMADAVFEFSHSFREFNLSETEISLVIPLQMCHSDPTLKDQEMPRMLRACYLYSLYEELCHNRGEQEGKILCSKILQVLDLLVPINEMYVKNVGSRILEA